MPSDNALVPDVRERLRAQFQAPVEEHGRLWSELWDEGSFLPWDCGAPHPALIDLLAERVADLVLDSTEGKKALVPGCGKGYDVVLFGSYGLAAAGLDISESAVEMARAHTKKVLEEKPISGTAKFVAGDFFKDYFVKELGAEDGFDFVYDYTFLCALPPTLRTAWAKRMHELVKPASGYLICVEFPLYKSLETGGPPWGLTSAVYDELLGVGFEKLIHYKPERTHEVGKASDYITVWRRRAD